jgi:predicted enzyme related to lactoylglutathione lyase
MNPIIHFEMPVVDTDRVRRFYESAFGWVTTPLGPEAGDFVLAFTTETDENRVPKKVGAINGGFYKRTEPDQQVRLAILVDDIREAMEKVAAAGGTVLGGTLNPGEPDDMPGVGLFAAFMDTEGNLATLYQDYGLKTLPDAPGA